MKNYNDVLNQLVNYGLRVDSLVVGRLVRCRVEGDRERRGWYILHELPQTGGESIIVGVYGIWRGDDNGLMKVELDKDNQLNKEEMAAIRKRVAEDKKRAESERKRRANAAADRAGAAWHNGSAEGHIDYLDTKNIQSHGLRYTQRGAAMVPMLNVGGQVQGVQFILDSEKHKKDISKHGRNKHYWPPGVSKKGHFHLIGGSPVDVLLIVEGYATGATIFEATGIPVAVAFDANNLLPVGEALKKHYKGIKLVICADDDAFSKCSNCKKSVNVNDSTDCPHCQQPHKKKNTGVETAGLASMQLAGYSFKPIFADEAARFEHYRKNKGKLTDFNDLQLIEGLHPVRVQIETAIAGFGIRRKALQNAGGNKPGDGDDTAVKPLISFEEIQERFVLIFGQGSIAYDKRYRIFIKLKDILDACSNREIYRRWHDCVSREVCLLHEVDFDPGDRNPSKKYNTFNGLKSIPKKGNCDLLLELLEYMCGPGEDGRLMYEFILNWLAFPLQHLGAKMKSCVVVHGPQGTGKNLFFEVVSAIYGEYAGTIDQPTLEDKFTDWRSKKLFIVADEVAARCDLQNVKNKMKGLITSETVRINPKTKISYEEKNQMNLVILSNESMPVALEEDDRRHAVARTPEKLSPEYYKDVAEEIKNGGVDALHFYLLARPLGDFDEHTKPPLTKDKEVLIEQGLKPTSRFYNSLINGDIFTRPDQKLWPVSHDQMYEIFSLWCAKVGVRRVPQHVLIADIKTKKGAVNTRSRCLINGIEDRARFLELPKCQEQPVGGNKKLFYTDCIKNTEDLLDYIRMEW